jgi:hypothetical protein
MTRSVELLSCLLLAALTVLAVCAIEMVRSAEHAVVSLPVQVDAAISREGREAREVMTTTEAAWRAMIERQIAAGRKDAKGESGHWREASIEELRQMRKEVIQLSNTQLSELIATLDSPADALTKTLEEYAKVPAVIGSRLDPWTDCKGNGACWQAQTTALLGASRVTSGEVSKTMRTVRMATPSVLANIDKTTANVERMTRPDSLSVKIIKLASPLVGGALFGAIK